MGLCGYGESRLARRRFALPLIDQALEWAFEQYNSSPELRAYSREFGHVLWSADGANLQPGARVVSSTAEEVSLYVEDVVQEMLSDYSNDIASLAGDMHAHIREAQSWMAHFPSDGDVSEFSAACDLYEFDPPLDKGIDCVPVAPKFQLVQSLLFGDAFVLKAVEGRQVFLSVAEQRRSMRQIAAAYRDWHSQCHSRLGAMTLPVRHSWFVDIVRSELDAMNACLRERVQADFVVNNGFRSDSPNFVADLVYESG